MGRITAAAHGGLRIHDRTQLEGGQALAAFFGIGRLLGGGVLGGELASVAFILADQLTGAMVIAAEIGELLLDITEIGPALFGVRVFIEHGLGEADEFDRDHGGEMVAERLGAGGLVDGLGDGLDLLDELGAEDAGFLEAEPVLMAALAPFGEVLFGDGVAIEIFFEDFLNFFGSVEPGDDFGAGLAVFEASAEFMAIVFGETGDFAGAGGVHMFLCRLWFGPTGFTRSR